MCLYVPIAENYKGKTYGDPKVLLEEGEQEDPCQVPHLQFLLAHSKFKASAGVVCVDFQEGQVRAQASLVLC